MLCPFVEIEYFKPSEKPFSDGLFAYMAAAPTAAAPTPIEAKKACTEAAYGAVPAPAVKNVTATPMAITRITTVPTAMTCIQSIFLISSIVQSVAFFRASRAASNCLCVQTLIVLPCSFIHLNANID